MINMTVWKKGGQYSGFSLDGHAEYAEAGRDVVCAAVSALALNTANSIESLTEDFFEQELSEDGGYLRMDFPNGAGEKASLLMDSLVLGIRGILDAWGDEYLTLTIEEV
ncbi:MAG: ribosomal-processing cysteine protease Prp [Lachnospiraceae bacterium]|nr:ribosomal-processing cysteine protease Prp [Lachnospiraceae bacterium]